MNFYDHYKLKGRHAFLGASDYHWINYNSEKVATAYKNYISKTRGTELHDFAARCIQLRQKLPRSKKTLNAYVNDAIGFDMTPEQILYFSDNCFGTADAISFDEKDAFLRIHDLKTGVVPAHMEQLFVYDALFCLEYKVKPKDIRIEDRIYQCDGIVVANPPAEDILAIMEKIIEFDKIIEELKAEVV